MSLKYEPTHPPPPSSPPAHAPFAPDPHAATPEGRGDAPGGCGGGATMLGRRRIRFLMGEVPLLRTGPRPRRRGGRARRVGGVRMMLARGVTTRPMAPMPSQWLQRVPSHQTTRGRRQTLQRGPCVGRRTARHQARRSGHTLGRRWSLEKVTLWAVIKTLPLRIGPCLERPSDRIEKEFQFQDSDAMKFTTQHDLVILKHSCSKLPCIKVFKVKLFP